MTEHMFHSRQLPVLTGPRVTLKLLEPREAALMMRFRVENRDASETDWLLVIFDSLVDELEFAEFRDGHLVNHVQTGDNMPYSARPSIIVAFFCR